jgi:hypothetical protein
MRYGWGFLHASVGLSAFFASRKWENAVFLTLRYVLIWIVKLAIRRWIELVELYSIFENEKNSSHSSDWVEAGVPLSPILAKKRLFVFLKRRREKSISETVLFFAIFGIS